MRWYIVSVGLFTVLFHRTNADFSEKSLFEVNTNWYCRDKIKLKTHISCLEHINSLNNCYILISIQIFISLFTDIFLG